MNAKFLILFFCLSLPPFQLSCELKSSNKAFGKDDAYKGAYNVSTYFNKKSKTHALRYKVALPYPSKEVLSHYQKRFLNEGYISCKKINKIYGDNEWSTHIDGTGDQDEYIHRIMNFWRNQEDTKIISVAIWYESNLKRKRESLPEGNVKDSYDQNEIEKLKKSPSSNEQNVVLQISPADKTTKDCRILE